MSRVTLPVTFKAVGSLTSGASFEPITRTITELQPDEVLARVSYASINAMDGKLSTSKVNMFQLPLPLVWGYDFSGTVVALGTDGAWPNEAEAVSVGSEVMASTFGFGWGAGCFAEYVVAKRDRVALRGDVPEPEAATLNIAYLSAYDPLVIVADIRKRAGQTIFIPGGAGGVGHFAVQLAKAYGLRVIASASKPEGLELLRKLGADVVLDYSKQDVVAAVLAETGGKGADVVYDSTYVDSSLQQSAATVAKGGVWLRLGPWLRSPPEVKQAVEDTVSQRGGSVLIGDLGKYARDPEWIAQRPKLVEGQRVARQLYAEGLLRPHISRTVPLEAATLEAALQESLTGVVGKWVVKA